MDFSKIKIPGFSIHTNEQKLAIIQKAITKKTESRLKTLKISSPPVFDVSFANYNLSNSDYHKTPFVSSSTLKRLKKSEKHYLDSSLMQYGSATKNSFAMGTLMHDDLENKIKTGEWMQWKAGTFKTKTTIKLASLEVHESTMKVIERYRKEFETDEILNKILMCADSEVSFFDHDDNEEEEEEENKGTKIRTDAVLKIGDRLEIVDFKSVADIERFKWDLINYSYDISAGMYTETLEKLTGYKVGFTFVLICKKTGLTKIVEVTDATMETYKERFHQLKTAAAKIDNSNPKGYELELF